MKQLSLYDVQTVNLNRVRGRIGPVVLDFCREHLGREFYNRDLEAYVTRRLEGAPDSPSRILRDLRQGGFVDYEVVNRRQSLYRITRVGNDESVNSPVPYLGVPGEAVVPERSGSIE